MSVQAMGWVIEHSAHGGGDLLVLLMIANHAKSDGTGAWPSVSTLAKECRMSERNVRYCLRRLEKGGELILEQAAGPHGSNLYSLPYVGGANIAGGKPLQGQLATVGGAKRDSRGGNLRPDPLQPIAPEPSFRTVLEPSMNHPLAADAGEASNITPDQTYLVRKLQERGEGWNGLAWSGIGRLNKDFGSQTVTEALRRMSEEDTVPAASFPLLRSVCQSLATRAVKERA